MAIAVGNSVASAGAFTTTCAVTIPTVANGAFLYVTITNRDATANVSVTDNDTGGNTWTRKTTVNANTNGSGQIWWKRATASTTGKVVSVSGATGSCSMTLTAYTGVSLATDPLGTPVGEANASGDESHVGITTGRAASWVLFSVHVTSNDTLNPASYTATDPTTLTERAEGTSTGGSDCSSSHASAEKATAGATGAINWAMTNGTAASIAVELLAAPDNLTAESGAFALSGAATTLKRALVLSAASASFALTGTAATLNKGITMSAASGSFIETGTAASLEVAHVLSAPAVSFAVAGTAAGLERGFLVSAASGAYAVTGTAATLTHDQGSARTLTADSGAFTATGTAASLERSLLVAASVGALALSGTAAGLPVAHVLASSPGAFVLLGSTASLVRALETNVESGGVAVVGAAAGLERGLVVSATAGALSVSGSAATLSYTGGQQTALAAAAGNIAISGTNAGLTIYPARLAVNPNNIGTRRRIGRRAAWSILRLRQRREDR